MQRPALKRPGPLPAGTYTTAYFCPGGLTVTVDDSWASQEDSTGEFNLSSNRNLDDGIQFWLDMTPVTLDGKPVSEIENTPQAVSDRLHGLSWLTPAPRSRLDTTWR